jgi:hypothetical protein
MSHVQKVASRSNRQKARRRRLRPFGSVRFISAAGATSATFAANTSIVLISTSVAISAAHNNTTQTASLSVLL